MMSNAGAFSVIKLVDRDPLRVFYNGYNSVLFGIVIYVFGSAILPLLAFFNGSSTQSVILLGVSVVLLWLYPIFVIAGFLMISVGMIVYITELSDKHKLKEKLEMDARLKEKEDIAAWGVHGMRQQ